jgi:hypothetical protein
MRFTPSMTTAPMRRCSGLEAYTNISEPVGNVSGKRRRNSTVLRPDMMSKACSGRTLIMMPLASIVSAHAL